MTVNAYQHLRTSGDHLVIIAHWWRIAFLCPPYSPQCESSSMSSTTIPLTVICCSQKVGDIILDIKNCSTYKSNETHLKQPVLIRLIYLRAMCITACKFHPGTWLLDQGSIPNFHMDLTWQQIMFQDVRFTQKHSPLFIFQVENLFLHCVFKLRNARHKRLYFSVNRHICLKFTLCLSPRDRAFDMRKKSGAYTI